jgi:hypothetical protein
LRKRDLQMADDELGLLAGTCDKCSDDGQSATPKAALTSSC